MRAGELRHRVVIERQRTTSGEWGREIAWSEIGRVWASVTASKGTERFDAKTSGTDAATRLTVRMRRTDVTAADRVVHDGRVLDIFGVVDPEGRGRELVVECVDNGETKNG